MPATSKEMMVQEVMTGAPEVVLPDATLQEAAQTMRSLDVGPLPVCDTGGKLIGIITDRDVTIRGTAEGRDPYTTYVRDIMTDDVVYVFEDQSVREAARIMQQRQVRRLPVLNRNRNLVGIVSLGDLALSDMEEDLTAETLESISTPA